MAAMMFSNRPAPDNAYHQDHIRLLRQSYSRLLKRPLLPPNLDDSQAAVYLFNAPLVVLSHNTDTDPIFNYANKAGLELFELTWAELIQLPSKKSAETVDQNERQRLLDQVTATGYIDNYHCIRISKSGKRFRIKNAIIWNLYDDNLYHGQAACFRDWDFIV